jgi:hypothetical protein
MASRYLPNISIPLGRALFWIASRFVSKRENEPDSWSGKARGNPNARTFRQASFLWIREDRPEEADA